MTLSVVIPIYNSEQYLDDCLRSVCALTAEDVTEAVYWVTTLPKHVNINTLEIMPVTQTTAGLKVFKG